MRQPSAAFLWLTHRNSGSPVRNLSVFSQMAHPWRIVAHHSGMVALSRRNNQYGRISRNLVVPMALTGAS